LVFSRGAACHVQGSGPVFDSFLPSVGEYIDLEGVPRRVRLEYPDAIYRRMARGSGRQDNCTMRPLFAPLRTHLKQKETKATKSKLPG